MYSHSRKAQSTLEYALLLVVIVAALLVTQTYVKRAFQGRLKGSSDDVGGQFQPGKFRSSLTTNTAGKTTERFGLDETDTRTKGVSVTNYAQDQFDRSGYESVEATSATDYNK